jgi:LPS-assembly lipoprotein
MWWPDRTRAKAATGPAWRVALATGALALLAGCTAQPLYSSSVAPAARTETGAADTASALGSINVAPVTTRAAQQVRNELIFLLTGGRGTPADAPYRLALSAYAFSESSAITQVTGLENAATSAIMTFVGSYTLTDAKTGRVVGSGERRATAAYDVSPQPFAAARAVRDAEDRSARDLAALVAASVAADLATGRKAAQPAAASTN